MRWLVLLFVSFLMTSPAWAYNDGDAILNKVIVKLSSEQWVTTKTALVTIGVNASVNENDLSKIQDNVLKNVSPLSSQSDWHVISFDRSVDQSGLEKVKISVQARLPSSALTSLREKTKTMSKPGETYTVDNVQFTPSEDEIRAASVTLRSNIYQQAKEELDRINKLYPDQKYYVHKIDFVGELQPFPIPMPLEQTNAMVQMRAVGASATNDLAVGDKMQVSATIVFAAMPLGDHSLIKNIT